MRATPTCIGMALVRPRTNTYVHAIVTAAHGPTAQAANSNVPAAASAILIPGNRLPNTQVTRTKYTEAVTSTPTIARPTRVASWPSTSSDKVDIASKPRNDIMQINVAVRT